MIIAKVAKIINERSLVINKGSEDGVKNGFTFRIYGSSGNSVVDPDTNELLGTLKTHKIDVRVQTVEKKYSIVETYKYAKVNVGGTGSGLVGVGFTNYFSPPKYVKKFETITIEEDDAKEIEESDSKVKVGDLAEQLTDNFQPKDGLL